MPGHLPSPPPDGAGSRHLRSQPTGAFSLFGSIGSSGFASGDRFVVGAWEESPLGPITDVMWATPAGTRILLADTAATADLVSSIYAFDEVRVVDIERTLDPHHLHVFADDVEIDLRAGPGWRLPFSHRPRWFTRFVEGPPARALLGVRTYGVTASGWREWYQAESHRTLRSARASIGGRDLGAMAPVDPPCRFGFSEPPRSPSLVRVRPRLEPVVP